MYSSDDDLSRNVFISGWDCGERRGAVVGLAGGIGRSTHMFVRWRVSSNIFPTSSLHHLLVIPASDMSHPKFNGHLLSFMSFFWLQYSLYNQQVVTGK
jgi:hypothetical protein